MICEY